MWKSPKSVKRSLDKNFAGDIHSVLERQRAALLSKSSVQFLSEPTLKSGNGSQSQFGWETLFLCESMLCGSAAIWVRIKANKTNWNGGLFSIPAEI